ncbi:hypothetical protein PsYK624_058620 [Phanerochaete sordida]|uniref:Uncharacterized protein n=1 Tax=Phanerochaete sordida TaxID=48140 RepID=A0A9P3LBR6_9APHY|nr:hypothetical protein PsYK624_058620 [Phanerochaete sordida]
MQASRGPGGQASSPRNGASSRRKRAEHGGDGEHCRSQDAQSDPSLSPEAGRSARRGTSDRTAVRVVDGARPSCGDCRRRTTSVLRPGSGAERSAAEVQRPRRTSVSPSDSLATRTSAACWNSTTPSEPSRVRRRGPTIVW